MFATRSDCLSGIATATNGGGRLLDGPQDNRDIIRLVNLLLDKDPIRLLDLTKQKGWESPTNTTNILIIGSSCAKRDPAGYVNWLEGQTDPGIRDFGTRALVWQLQNERRYAEAANWALQCTSDRDVLLQVISSWNGNDPSEVRQWLETAKLPADDRSSINQTLQENP